MYGFFRYRNYEDICFSTVFETLSGLACSTHYGVGPRRVDLKRKADPHLATIFLPWSYFTGADRKEEPERAGLFLKTSEGQVYQIASKKEGIFLCLGEFGQLVCQGEIKAPAVWTVPPKDPEVESLSMKVILEPNPEFTVRSTDSLAGDPRYFRQFSGGWLEMPSRTDGLCAYKDWKVANA